MGRTRGRRGERGLSRREELERLLMPWDVRDTCPREWPIYSSAVHIAED